MGWVDPWVGSSWVEILAFWWVGLVVGKKIPQILGRQELAEYTRRCRCRLPTTVHSSSWRQHAREFPVLSQVARWVVDRVRSWVQSFHFAMGWVG